MSDRKTWTRWCTGKLSLLLTSNYFFFILFSIYHHNKNKTRFLNFNCFKKWQITVKMGSYKNNAILSIYKTMECRLLLCRGAVFILVFPDKRSFYSYAKFLYYLNTILYKMKFIFIVLIIFNYVFVKEKKCARLVS